MGEGQGSDEPATGNPARWNFSDLTGTTLGKYRLVEKVGQGGMAQVYKAYQPDLDRYVAVKILHPHLTSDDEFAARFQREARTVAALEHPNIVRIYDFGTDGIAFLVMEYVVGTALKARLHELHCRSEVMSPAEAAHIVSGSRTRSTTRTATASSTATPSRPM